MHDFPYKHHHELCDHDFDDCCKQCAESKQRVKDHLLRFHEKISEFSEADLRGLAMPELYQHFLVLDDIAHLEVGEYLAQAIVSDPEVREILPALREYYLLFFDLHENALAEAILISSDPWTVLRRYVLFQRYEQLIRDQQQLLEDRDVRRMVFIGSGPLPVTLILADRIMGATSIGLDMNEQAVDLSLKVLDKLGVKDVAVRRGDESAFTPDECDAVLVAALAEPKDRIIRVLAGKLDGRDTPVVLRTYSGLRTLLHEPFTANGVQGFKETARIMPTGRVNNTLIRLRRA